jgi:hypothetical protein
LAVRITGTGRLAGDLASPRVSRHDIGRHDIGRPDIGRRPARRHDRRDAVASA